MFKVNKRNDVGFVIQARLGSSRLPGKALLYYRGSTIIDYLLSSLIEQGISKDRICVATSTAHFDDVLTAYLLEKGYTVIRGDEANVFSRFQKVAQETGFKNIVRLTGDNPMIIGGLLKYCVTRHLQGKNALTSTREIHGTKITRYVPKGLSVDVISSDVMLSIDSESLNPFEREHVIPVFFSKHDVQVITDYNVEKQDGSIDTLDDYVRLFEI